MSAPARAAIESTGEPSPAAELSIIVPTFNERDNIGPLIERLSAALTGVDWQATFVDDDSPDGTWQEVRRWSALDRRISCLRRIGRRGLSGAVLEGALSCSGAYVAVIDADLQHDERLLMRMLAALRTEGADLVVACRRLDNADDAFGLSPFRRRLSRLANQVCGWVTKTPLSDPLSGFFMMRRAELDRLAPQLSPKGFKILFDILATAKGGLKVLETPYVFRPRAAGRSKFDQRVAADYAALALSKVSRNLVSPRTIVFGLVGLSGLLVHLAVLRMTLALGLPAAQLLGAVAAMTSNYLLNNALTYRDRSRRGWRLFAGYVKFVMLCGLGLVANVGAATMASNLGSPWFVSGILGAVVGAAWNYLTTATAVWG